jgi:thiol-disulfide isomerase/thioredoxin
MKGKNMSPNQPSERSRRLTRQQRVRILAAFSLAAVLVTPASSFAATKAKSKVKSTKPAKAAIFKSDLPSMKVLDLSNGKQVDLAAFADGKKPSLIWFWAPHWGACAGEAPGVEQFAQQNASSINVLGIGTQDDAKQAVAFRTRHKLKVTKMVWDSTGTSWEKLGIPGQPAWLLMDKAGKTLAADTGGIPYEDVLKSLK